MNKQELLEFYIELAKKLGKTPTVAVINKFGVSERQVVKHFDSFGNLKVAALKKEPSLQDLLSPVKATYSDVQNLRFSAEVKENKNHNNKIIAEQSFFEYLEQFSENVFKGKIKTGKKQKHNTKLNRTHTLMLSDLHIGSDIKGDETGTTNFSYLEESRRFAAVIKQACEYKSQYRKNSRLVVALLGDIIENMMHDSRTGATLAEQCARAIHIISQGIAYLSLHYPEVIVECATGNHDRNTARHKQRAVHQKFDSIGTIIYVALKSTCSALSNVKFNIPKTPLSSYEVYGKHIAYTHGDTVINPGGVYTSVNVKALENQINKINAALPDKQEYAAILYGHTHIAHVVHLSNGTVLIGNGALPPADDFAVSIGSFESNNGQWIFESVPGYPVGDMRLIKCGKEYDKDESLDKIIKPWKNF